MILQHIFVAGLKIGTQGFHAAAEITVHMVLAKA